MKIDPKLMEAYDTALSEHPGTVRLGPAGSDGGLSAKVMPCSMLDWGKTCEALGEALALRDFVAEIMQTEGKGSDETFIARIIDLFEKAPEIRVQWSEIIQPNTNVDLDRITLFEFAQIAFEFFASSARGPEGEGWAELAKKAKGVFGPPSPPSRSPSGT